MLGGRRTGLAMQTASLNLLTGPHERSYDDWNGMVVACCKKSGGMKRHQEGPVELRGLLLKEESSSGLVFPRLLVKDVCASPLLP